MAEQAGMIVLGILEAAGERFLEPAAPELNRVFMLQIGGGPTVRNYTPEPVYWSRVQKILDGFFTSRERAEICGQLIERVRLDQRPEAFDFLALALAERRLQELRVSVRSVAGAGTGRLPPAPRDLSG
jgi:hypothetical protein